MPTRLSSRSCHSLGHEWRSGEHVAPAATHHVARAAVHAGQLRTACTPGRARTAASTPGSPTTYTSGGAGKNFTPECRWALGHWRPVDVTTPLHTMETSGGCAGQDDRMVASELLHEPVACRRLCGSSRGGLVERAPGIADDGLRHPPLREHWRGARGGWLSVMRHRSISRPLAAGAPSAHALISPRVRTAPRAYRVEGTSREVPDAPAHLMDSRKTSYRPTSQCAGGGHEKARMRIVVTCRRRGTEKPDDLPGLDFEGTSGWRVPATLFLVGSGFDHSSINGLARRIYTPFGPAVTTG